MSWLAAATNRVFETLASSASALARSSSALSRVSSPVRSRTRRSSVALARSSASAAFTLGVMSVKVVTRPPSGMRFAAHFDHQAAFGEAFEERLGFGGVSGDAFGDEFVDVLGIALAVLGRCGARCRRARCRRASIRAAGRRFRRTAGSSRPAPAPCRTRRCLGARDRARSAGFRGCSGSRHWRRREV